MGINYKGIDLNVAGDLKPWAPKETDVFQGIIDAISIGTVEGSLTGAKVIGHRHFNLFSETTNIESLKVTNSETVEIYKNLRVLSMTSEGFLKNDNSGNVSGGNTIDISDIVDQLPPHFLNGFENRDDSVISFVNGTRTFTIDVQGPATEYVMWSNNAKYTKTTPDSIVIPDTEGPVLIYFDDDGNLATIYQGDPNIINIYLRWALVAVVNWDVTNQVQNFIGEERHGIVMSPATTLYLHSVLGSQLESKPGFACNNFQFDTGNLDADAQFAVTGGIYCNEDIMLTYTATVPQDIDPIVNAPVYYLEGNPPAFRKNPTTAFPVKSFVGGSGRLHGMKITVELGNKRKWRIMILCCVISM